MSIEWAPIFAASSLFMMGAITPGPSLGVVVRNTALGGRRRGVACAIGHACGFGLYALGAVVGVTWILSQLSPFNIALFELFTIALLFYLGVTMIAHVGAPEEHEAGGERRGFIEGFMIAFLNPKIALFMIAVLSSVLTSEMTFMTQCLIALTGMMIDGAWYVIVALMITHSALLGRLDVSASLMQRTTGGGMLMFGAFLLSRFEWAVLSPA